MGNYTIFGGFENPRRDRQARNFTITVSKILDIKSSSEQIFSINCRWVPLFVSLHFMNRHLVDISIEITSKNDSLRASSPSGPGCSKAG